MRKTVTAICSLVVLCVAACDGYKYNGMNGQQALNAANAMDLEQAYDFYVKSYTKTHPPMLDVAKTFSRFGSTGIDYITNRALNSKNRMEFEADMAALMVLDANCSVKLKQLLLEKANHLGAERALVNENC